MKSKAKKQRKNIKYIIGAPIRFLAKAADFYVKSMTDCAGKVGHGSAVFCPVPQLPRSFSVASSKVSDDKKLRELIKVVVSNKTSESNKEFDAHRQTMMARQLAAPSGVNGVCRSYSVGVGRIGRIDEEKPCDFVEDEFKADMFYPRCRSHAITRRLGN